MIKLRGFGGKTQFWEHNLESFTLMAGLAAVTERIKIFATAATLTMPPAIVARMASTIDSIAPGRFGINLITGWQKAEYDQMGLWPGEQHYKDRYNYLAEYAQILRELLDTGVSRTSRASISRWRTAGSARGRRTPRSSAPVPATRAWPSPPSTPTTASPWARGPIRRPPSATSTTRLAAAKAKTGRDVGAYILFMIIADDTDEAAMAKWHALPRRAPTRRRSPG